MGEEEEAEVEASVLEAEEEEGEEVGNLVMMMVTSLEFICKSWTGCIRTIVPIIFACGMF